MTIQIEYNEFSNWEFPVKVRHPECDHPDNYRDLGTVGSGEITRELMFCTICKAIALPDSEDGYDWEHEK